VIVFKSLSGMQPHKQMTEIDGKMYSPTLAIYAHKETDETKLLLVLKFWD